MIGRREPEHEFAAFVRTVEPKLRAALVSTYGPVDGRALTVDALGWAWEHWDRMESIGHPVAYLYRVGQTASRRYSSRPVPPELLQAVHDHIPEITPELLPALGRLSEQQRTVVLLVHAFGWSQREVAAVIDISPSTVRQHLERAMTRLRSELEVSDGI